MFFWGGWVLSLEKNTIFVFFLSLLLFTGRCFPIHPQDVLLFLNFCRCPTFDFMELWGLNFCGFSDWAWITWESIGSMGGLYIYLDLVNAYGNLVGRYTLGCPPSQDSSGKWRFSSGSPTKNIIILVVTVTGHGDNLSSTSNWEMSWDICLSQKSFGNLSEFIFN